VPTPTRLTRIVNVTAESPYGSDLDIAQDCVDERIAASLMAAAPAWSAA
jgi:hypothetical protein